VRARGQVRPTHADEPASYAKLMAMPYMNDNLKRRDKYWQRKAWEKGLMKTNQIEC
jgi:hypothetical protein